MDLSIIPKELLLEIGAYLKRKDLETFLDVFDINNKTTYLSLVEIKYPIYTYHYLYTCNVKNYYHNLKYTAKKQFTYKNENERVHFIRLLMTLSICSMGS